MFWQDGAKVVIGHVHHDAPTGCICAPVAHCTLCGECLCRPALICDAVVGLGRVTLDALLGAADGVGEQRIDARVLAELGRESSTAGGAVLLALAQPALEARQAKVMLAGALYNKHRNDTTCVGQ